MRIAESQREKPGHFTPIQNQEELEAIRRENDIDDTHEGLTAPHLVPHAGGHYAEPVRLKKWRNSMAARQA